MAVNVLRTQRVNATGSGRVTQTVTYQWYMKLRVLFQLFHRQLNSPQ